MIFDWRVGFSDNAKRTGAPKADCIAGRLSQCIEIIIEYFRETKQSAELIDFSS